MHDTFSQCQHLDKLNLCTYYNYSHTCKHHKFLVLTKIFLCCRARRSRVRTVPNSRANSSKQSKLELEPVLGKRSRSASEEPFSMSSEMSPRSCVKSSRPTARASPARRRRPCGSTAGSWFARELVLSLMCLTCPF